MSQEKVANLGLMTDKKYRDLLCVMVLSEVLRNPAHKACAQIYFLAYKPKFVEVFCATSFVAPLSTYLTSCPMSYIPVAWR